MISNVTNTMGLLSKFWNLNYEKSKQFRGQGYSEEGALHHAEQRFQAWIKESEREGNNLIISTKKISFVQKNPLLKVCYIDCKYKKSI